MTGCSNSLKVQFSPAKCLTFHRVTKPSPDQCYKSYRTEYHLNIWPSSAETVLGLPTDFCMLQRWLSIVTEGLERGKHGYLDNLNTAIDFPDHVLVVSLVK